MSSEMNLEQIAEIIMGQSPSGETCNTNGQGMPLLNGPTEFGPNNPKPAQYTVDAKKRANQGDLLFCVRGSTTGKMNWSDQTYAIGRGIAAIRGKNGYPTSFVRAVIEYNLQNLLAQATGSTFPNVSQNLLKELKTTYVSAGNAKCIAIVLDIIDDKVNLLRETNATLESIAQTIFKSWFVDFDPVRARAEGRQPEGIDAETAALFPDSFEESEFGIVPKGWGITTLNTAYEINPIRKLKKDEIAPYLDMSNVPTSGHHPDIVINRKMGSGSKFMNGDTLLARITPCLENGKTAFVDFLLVDQIGWGSTEFVVLRPKPPLPPYHGYLLSRHTPFREFAVQSMSGTSGRQRIQNDVLGRYPVVIPTNKINEVFNTIVTTIQEKITLNSKQIHTLASLRDTLLPRLISGQLQLPNELLKEDAK